MTKDREGDDTCRDPFPVLPTRRYEYVPSELLFSTWGRVGLFCFLIFSLVRIRPRSKNCALRQQRNGRRWSTRGRTDGRGNRATTFNFIRRRATAARTDGRTNC